MKTREAFTAQHHAPLFAWVDQGGGTDFGMNPEGR
jgi:hypothetical protein